MNATDYQAYKKCQTMFDILILYLFNQKTSYQIYRLTSTPLIQLVAR